MQSVDGNGDWDGVGDEAPLYVIFHYGESLQLFAGLVNLPLRISRVQDSKGSAATFDTPHNQATVDKSIDEF